LTQNERNLRLAQRLRTDLRRISCSQEPACTKAIGVAARSIAAAAGRAARMGDFKCERR